MKKLFAFLLCVVMLFSFLASCSSDDSPVTDDGGEIEPETPKRFIPAQEGDSEALPLPDDVQSVGRDVRIPYGNDYLFNQIGASSRDEMVNLLSTLPYDAIYGYYATTLYRLRQEGFYIEPQFDGKSVFNRNEKLFLVPNGGDYHQDSEWGYSCQLDMGKEKDLYVNIYYLPQRYVEYAREYPCLYNNGKPNSSERSDEELIRNSSDSRRELALEGKKAAAYWQKADKDRQTLTFICDAGYMVTLESRNGDNLDLLEIAEKMSFVKVPLEKAAVMQGPGAPYGESYYGRVLGANSRDEMIHILTAPVDTSSLYNRAMHFVGIEAFFVEPGYDGQSVFDRNEALYIIPNSGNNYDSTWWGYHTVLKLDQGDLYVNVMYLDDDEAEQARELPCNYQNVVSSQEELEKSIYEVTVEGKKTKAYLRTNSEYSQTLYFVCDAGYMVTLESRNGDNLDLLAIAEKMSFTKVPLTTTTTE